MFDLEWGWPALVRERVVGGKGGTARRPGPRRRSAYTDTVITSGAHAWKGQKRTLKVFSVLMLSLKSKYPIGLLLDE